MCEAYVCVSYIFCPSVAAVCQGLANDGYYRKLTYNPCTLAVVSML
jgi:hypothetical protein